MAILPQSDAGRWAMIAAMAVTIVALAWIGDRRRVRRSQPDRVGFMPWTGIFLFAVLVAVVCGGLAAKLWFFPL